ncbi:MAG: M48 family metallopeptidase [Gammaproteobacteria bacterium]
MNFFEHQQSARRQSRLIIAGFVAVSLLIIFVVDLVVMAVLSVPNGAASFLSAQQLNAHSGALLASSGATAGIISLSSLGKIASLKSGGGKVAKSMGATLVSADVRDPLRRRYYNVVEEIAIASGVPVPEVYVMEDEPGINAFAAGYSASDAAVAVTQGALERLTRSELQGVIAHEFSHIFNGDMRINIRMMGVLFGILIAAVIGRKLVTSSRYMGRSSREGAGVMAAVVSAGFALMIVGYIGLFFARWMKARLSQQREYLADASAVQFTRDPDGIAGALKKIAAYGRHSHLQGDSEEVSHMLFGSGKRRAWFATHPPILKRIQRIQPGFNEEQLDALATRLRANEHREHEQAVAAEKELAEKKGAPTGGGMFDVDSMIDSIGNPGVESIFTAAMVAASIPQELSTASRSIEWAPEVLLYCLLDRDVSIRDQQLLIVARQRGDIGLDKLSFLLNLNQELAPNQRLPLMEMTFPALKQRPVSDIEKLIETVNLLVHADDQVDAFEYLLARQITLHLNEAKYPSSVVTYGNEKLDELPAETALVLSVLAKHGHAESGAAEAAYAKGAAVVNLDHPFRYPENWYDDMDEALEKLNELRLDQKKALVLSLSEIVTNDGVVVSEEHEMMRAICASIHVPLPVFQHATG